MYKEIKEDNPYYRTFEIGGKTFSIPLADIPPDGFTRSQLKEYVTIFKELEIVKPCLIDSGQCHDDCPEGTRLIDGHCIPYI